MASMLLRADRCHFVRLSNSKQPIDCVAATGKCFGPRLFIGQWFECYF